MVTLWPTDCRPTAASTTSLSAPPMPKSGWTNTMFRGVTVVFSAEAILAGECPDTVLTRCSGPEKSIVLPRAGSCCRPPGSHLEQPQNARTDQRRGNAALRVFPSNSASPVRCVIPGSGLRVPGRDAAPPFARRAEEHRASRPPQTRPLAAVRRCPLDTMPPRYQIWAPASIVTVHARSPAQRSLPQPPSKNRPHV